MKRKSSIVAAVAFAAFAVPAAAQHVHEQAQAAPQAGPPAGAPARGPQTPPIDVPWNDSIPAGTVEHAARALKESPRHGEWVDIKMADGTILKSWVVYPERSTKTGVVLVIHDIRGMADMTRAVGDQLAQDGFIAILPYGMRYTSASMLQIHKELEESAAVSGASWGVTFRRVVLPLLKPGLLAGWIYVVIVSIRELSSSILLYSPGSEVVSIMIWELWQNGQYVELSALGVMLIAALFCLVVLAQLAGRRFGIAQA